MSKANTAAEPSMEEILASIRRIIADEDAQPKASPPKPAAVEAPPPKKIEPKPAPEPEPEPVAEDEDVLDLAMAQAEAEMVAETNEAAALDDGLADLGFVEPQAPIEPDPEPEPEPAPIPPSKPAARAAPPPPPPPERAPRPAPPDRPSSPETPLMSEEAGHAASQAFGALAQAIFSHEPRTIEDLTKELLRPMVKSWLDDNLPGLVERLVREEIERVARGRR